MSLDFFNKLRTYSIQNNYKLFSKYLLKIQYHINYLNDYHIISLYERNLFIGKIYEVIKELNNTYNKEILDDKLVLPHNISTYIDIEYFMNNYTMKECYEILLKLDLLDNNNCINNLINQLHTCKHDIINLTSQYGNTDINIILTLIVSENLELFYDKHTIEFLSFLNNLFIPTKFYYSEKNYESLYNNHIYEKYDDISSADINQNSDSQDTMIDYFKDINIFRKSNNNDELLNRVICLEIKLQNNKCFIIEGLFKIDSMNIILKTCQIANKFIYFKKKSLEKILKKTETTKKFRKTFFYLCILQYSSFTNAGSRTLFKR